MLLEILINAGVVFAIFAISLLVATYSTLAERKVAGIMQDRYGPERAGPFGLLQPLADAAKFFFKEEIIPTDSNRFLFILGPCLAMFTACLTSAVIPWSRDFNFGSIHIPMQIANLNIGILYIFGILSLGVYGIMIGGWASNNKFSLLGAVRASSQMISYELAMGIAVIAVLMMTGSLNLRDIVEGQSAWNGMRWNIILQPIGFLIFIICAFAECNRAPFDLAECENELVGGYHTEYSSMKLGLFLFAEYVNMFISGAVISSLYLGGYNFPGIQSLTDAGYGNLVAGIGFAVFFTKIILCIFVFMWVRWTLPRFRYDQLMKLGWQILIPLSILNLMVTGGVILLNL
ncbi:MAG: NADH-quinone oxidoreductase subunit NuoH [Bacteroidota bacterium]|nr:NADH-quinone oxidoreductase subunit NuoH [Bacteroidota bacterium]